MKKVLFFCLLVGLFSTSLFAQSEKNSDNDFNHIVGVSPFTLWHGVRVKYENVLTQKLTVGGTLTGYYGTFPGVQIAPAVRFYFKGNAPEGFYAQAKIVGGYHSHTYTTSLVEQVFGGEEEETFTTRFDSYGGGVAAGYQLLWGKNDKWTMDFNLGLKFATGNPGSVSGFLGWGLAGPGSIVDGLVSIGYRF
jgi:hypothetical protein